MSFDAVVKVGEVRVFADTKEPLVALVLESRGLAGYRIVPVSPYRVPVNDAEIAIGERVFQLWNVCTAAKGFARRSWIADTLSAEDVARVREAVAAQGGLPKELGEYERRQLVAGGDFKGWSAKFPQPSVVLNGLYPQTAACFQPSQYRVQRRLGYFKVRGQALDYSVTMRFTGF